MSSEEAGAAWLRRLAWWQRAVIPVTSGMWGYPQRGTAILIDEGSPYEEALRVVVARDGQITVTRWRWYHTLLSRPRRSARRIRGGLGTAAWSVQAARVRLVRGALRR